MNQGKGVKDLAKGLVNVLNVSLRINANSTSCVAFYQPKEPKELSRFRRSK